MQVFTVTIRESLTDEFAICEEVETDGCFGKFYVLGPPLYRTLGDTIN